MWAANSKYKRVEPTVAIPQPFGIWSSFWTTLTLLHLPNVANKSVCYATILSYVITKASGLICGGMLTLEAIDLKHAADLLTT